MRKRFLKVCWALLAVMAVGAIVSIAAGWPAQFGGAGDPDKIASEFVTQGTALAPPLWAFLLFAVFVAVAARRRMDRWATAAVGGTILLGIAFVVGGLGEVFAESTPDVPRAAQSANIVPALLAAAVVVTGVAYLRQRAQAKRGAGQSAIGTT